ncbi:AMIN-like domain-containing (lipo)protein [Schaalia sp. lx-100]|uniref:AMIN-like domain-containing (lipo)protein n=1 Tax=Schaalia sp. lx-100 TaxID=2899081 RepID=UPI001E2ADAD5|nr:hypothetical protein [Schaalia sp. lx-100]MCD4556667.1 hypothetical protein [Schaalia sp. lx-100]
MSRSLRCFVAASAVSFFALSLAGCSHSQSAQDVVSSAATSTSATQSSASLLQSGASGAQSIHSEADASPIASNDWKPLADSREVSDHESSLVLHDVRVGHHEGFDRVVIEFAGEGDTGWMLQWVTQAHEQGRGMPLPLKDPAILDVVLTNTVMPIDQAQQAQYYSGPRTFTSNGVTVAVDGTFESHTHIALGLDSQRPHQIAVLTQPTRIVIDLKK